MDCCNSTKGNEPCCRLESVVSIDERGQMILPKSVREKANIQAGDKLVLISCGQVNDVGCLTLVKIEELNKMVQQTLRPALKESVK